MQHDRFAALHPELATAIHDSHLKHLLSKVTSQAFALPVLSPACAARVAAELRTATARDTYNLDSAEFPVAREVASLLQNDVLPGLASIIEPGRGRLCEIGRAYALRYSTSDAHGIPDQGRTHRVHVDDCEVTLAVCLDGTWHGADLCYIEPPADGRPRPSTPDPSDPSISVARHRHECGMGVVHSGDAYHFVDDLHSGERFTIVVQAMWDDGAAWKRTFLQRPLQAPTFVAADPTRSPPRAAMPSQPSASVPSPPSAAIPPPPIALSSSPPAAADVFVSAASLLRWSHDTSTPRADVETILTAEPLEKLGHMLHATGRPSVLTRLRVLGVSRLADRQKLCNALSRAMREGALNRVGELPPDFEAAATRMPAYARRVLLRGCPGEDEHAEDGAGGGTGESDNEGVGEGGDGTPAEQAAALIASLQAAACAGAHDATAQLDSTHAPASTGEMLSIPHALSSAACAVLRDAVDARRSVERDSVVSCGRT